MMKELSSYKRLIFILGLFLLSGCKQPEKIVIEQGPTVVPNDTVSAEAADNEAGFRQLIMGEYRHIRTLDPLFADHPASMRAVQLLYEGLVRLDEQGNVIPGLAKNWTVSDDSLQYRFTLRSDVYYHDSDIFSTGTGRKLKADDVKYVFERMAKSSVPPLAAQQFMEIEGFNSYFQEQRLVYNPEERNLKGITGIKTPDAQTVIFNLDKRDPDFLKELATPLAVIYPKEAVAQQIDGFTAVGTGPFKFNRRTIDSTLIFAKFQNYYADSLIHLNRVDIKVETSESRLFRTMSAGEIYLLPQLGPQIISSILNSDGTLLSSYRSDYTLKRAGGPVDYTLRHYSNSSLSVEGAHFIGSLLAADSTAFLKSLPGRYISASTAQIPELSTPPASLNKTVYSTYHNDPFIRAFLGSLSTALAPYNRSLKMLNIHAPSQNTGLFLTKDYPLIPNQQWDNQTPLFHFSVDQLALKRPEIKHLDYNRYPWWFDLRGVTLPASENMN